MNVENFYLSMILSMIGTLLNEVHFNFYLTNNSPPSHSFHDSIHIHINMKDFFESYALYVSVTLK